MSKKDEWFQTSCGFRVYPGDWKRSDEGWLSPAVLANALAKVNRFNGHTQAPYSVAQHSYWVFSRVYTWLPSMFRLQALLHDATEAFMNDLVRAVKCQLGGYRKLEKELWSIIADTYKVPRKMHPAVKLWDNVACAVERRSLQLRPLLSPLEKMRHVSDLADAEANVVPCCWQNARDLFQDTLEFYGPKTT